jgi:hypothetical protein
MTAGCSLQKESVLATTRMGILQEFLQQPARRSTIRIGSPRRQADLSDRKEDLENKGERKRSVPYSF